jgi:hypothetical protein
LKEQLAVWPRGSNRQLRALEEAAVDSHENFSINSWGFLRKLIAEVIDRAADIAVGLKGSIEAERCEL